MTAIITEPIGRDARDLFAGGQLGADGTWRRLRFPEFTIRMRDAIAARIC